MELGKAQEHKDGETSSRSRAFERLLRKFVLRAVRPAEGQPHQKAELLAYFALPPESEISKQKAAHLGALIAAVGSTVSQLQTPSGLAVLSEAISLIHTWATAIGIPYPEPCLQPSITFLQCLALVAPARWFLITFEVLLSLLLKQATEGTRSEAIIAASVGLVKAAPLFTKQVGILLARTVEKLAFSAIATTGESLAGQVITGSSKGPVATKNEAGGTEKADILKLRLGVLLQVASRLHAVQARVIHALVAGLVLFDTHMHAIEDSLKLSQDSPLHESGKTTLQRLAAKAQAWLEASGSWITHWCRIRGCATDGDNNDHVIHWKHPEENLLLEAVVFSFLHQVLPLPSSRYSQLLLLETVSPTVSGAHALSCVRARLQSFLDSPHILPSVKFSGLKFLETSLSSHEQAAECLARSPGPPLKVPEPKHQEGRVSDRALPKDQTDRSTEIVPLKQPEDATVKISDFQAVGDSESSEKQETRRSRRLANGTRVVRSTLAECTVVDGSLEVPGQAGGPSRKRKRAEGTRTTETRTDEKVEAEEKSKKKKGRSPEQNRIYRAKLRHAKLFVGVELSGWNGLEEHVLSDVFELLPPKDCAAVVMTCKNWKRVGQTNDNVWKKLYSWQHGSLPPHPPQAPVRNLSTCSFRELFLQRWQVSRRLNKVYVCEFCGLGFSQAGRLKHLPIHIRPFKCTVEGCSDAFPRALQLEKHMAAVHGLTDRLKCERCSKKFGSQAALDSHTMTHQGKYQCWLRRQKAKMIIDEPNPS